MGKIAGLIYIESVLQLKEYEALFPLQEFIDFTFFVSDTAAHELLAQQSLKAKIIKSHRIWGSKIKMVEATAKVSSVKTFSMRGFLRQMTPKIIINRRYVKRLISEYEQMKAEVAELFNKNSFDFVMAAGDRAPGNYQLVLLAMAKKCKIPFVVLSASLGADVATLLYNRRGDKEYQAGYFPVGLSQRFPQIFRYSNYDVCEVSFFTVHRAKALENTALLSANPWVLGGSGAHVLAPSTHVRDLLIENECNPDAIKITGSPSHDRIYTELLRVKENHQELQSQFTLQDKFLLVALPQYKEHGILAEDEHWKEIEFLLRTARRAYGNVVVALHPKMKRSEYEFLQQKYNVRILDKDLKFALSACSGFLSTFSSTVEWALALGKPVVITDFLGMNYGLYNAHSRVQIVSVRDHLLSALFRMNKTETLNDGDTYFGQIDGQAHQRILSQLSTLTRGEACQI